VTGNNDIDTEFNSTLKDIHGSAMETYYTRNRRLIVTYPS
jgi:hypothetical protein